MSCDLTSCCKIEVPTGFCDQLSATLTVSLLEVPSHAPTNIINHNQDYVVTVAVELGAQIKRMLCGKWCVNLAVESCGPGLEFRRSQTIDMDNCHDDPDTVTFRLSGRDFESNDSNHCGDVFYLCVTVVALDPCEGKPIGIAGFCKLGPVMVY